MFLKIQCNFEYNQNLNRWQTDSSSNIFEKTNKGRYTSSYVNITFQSFDLDPSRSELRRPSHLCVPQSSTDTHKEFLALGLLFKEICVRDSNGTLHLN